MNICVFAHKYEKNKPPNKTFLTCLAKVTILFVESQRDLSNKASLQAVQNLRKLSYLALTIFLTILGLLGKNVRPLTQNI